jgi:hypothetical protein
MNRSGSRPFLVFKPVLLVLMYHYGTTGPLQIELVQAQVDRACIAVPGPFGEQVVIVRPPEQILLLLRPGAGGGIGFVLLGHGQRLSWRHGGPYRPDAPIRWYKRTSAAGRLAIDGIRLHHPAGFS